MEYEERYERRARRVQSQQKWFARLAVGGVAIFDVNVLVDNGINLHGTQSPLLTITALGLAGVALTNLELKRFYGEA